MSRWNSEPDLPSRKQKVEQQKDKNQGNWIQRHLSFKKKKRNRLESTDSTDTPSPDSPLASDKRTSSSPILIMCDDDGDRVETAQAAAYRRPSCIDNVVPLSIFKPKPPLRNRSAERQVMGALAEEEKDDKEPPKIVQTDFDEEKLDKG